jgi:hypothetical protein
VPDALPFVGPGVDHALGDLDGHRPGGDAALEVIGNLASGDVEATDGDGSNLATYDPSPPSGENAADKSKVLNLFETAIVADFDGASPGLEVLKGGVTLNQLLNIGVAVGQNLPYYHLLQAWTGDPAAGGTSLATFPQAVEDFQLLSSPAVADVSDGPGAEAIVGTGLYLIRAINAQGLEAPGWPKFTGGWNFAVPAIGDVDGDSKLEVATTTREGFSFLWETDAEACGGNEEWWTSRHDEWSSGAYGTDSRPPGTPEGLSADSRPGAVALSWTAPGDDWLCGRAAGYRVLAADGPIDSPDDGRVVGQGDASSDPGESQSHEVARASLRNATHVAVLYRDDSGNWGRLAAVALTNPSGRSAGAADEPASPPEPSGSSALPAPHAGPCSNRLVGSRKDDRLVGTAGPDQLRSRGGDDRLRSLGGDDCAVPGRGRDRVDAGEGADRVVAADGRRDRIICGPGDDVVISDRNDGLRGCEEVERR